MFRLTLALAIGMSLCSAFSHAQQLQGPRFSDRESRDTDVARREAMARQEQLHRDAQSRRQRRSDEDYYTRVHPDQPRVGDRPGLPYRPDTSERSTVNPCMTVSGSRIPNCSR